MRKPVVNPREWGYGTSLQGHIIASFAELQAMFGPPLPESDGYKVSTEWHLRFFPSDGGVEATIYDYNDTSLYDDGLPSVEEFRALPQYEWHIGGTSRAAVNAVTRYVDEWRKANPKGAAAPATADDKNRTIALSVIENFVPRAATRLYTGKRRDFAAFEYVMGAARAAYDMGGDGPGSVYSYLSVWAFLMATRKPYEELLRCIESVKADKPLGS